MATRGKSARIKGHVYERDVVDFFKDLGWENCCTSRSESKRADDEGRDIMYVDPFYVQAKAVENLGSLHKVLSAMPQRKTHYNLVFHKRSRQGSVVAMTIETFKELLEMLVVNSIIKPK